LGKPAAPRSDGAGFHGETATRFRRFFLLAAVMFHPLPAPTTTNVTVPEIGSLDALKFKFIDEVSTRAAAIRELPR
jgi:hypothetical protein